MPSLYLDPNADGTTQDWFGDYTDIDDAVRNPTATGFSGSISSFSEDQIGEFVVDTIGATSGDSTSVNIWFNADTEDPKSVNLKWGGSWKTEVTSYSTGGDSTWKKAVWTIADDLSSGITGIQMRFVCSQYEDDFIRCAYVEVEYSESGPGPGGSGSPWNYYVQQGGV